MSLPGSTHGGGDPSAVRCERAGTISGGRTSHPAATLRLEPGTTALRKLRFAIQPTARGQFCYTPAIAEVTVPGRPGTARTLWPYGRICADLNLYGYELEN